jgi:hypothetical protein
MVGPRTDRRAFLAAGWSLCTGIMGSASRAGEEGPAEVAIRVGPIRRVGPDGVKYIEPWICANPRDDRNLIVVGSVYRGPSPDTLVRTVGEVRYTTDGGATWSAGVLPGMDEFRDRPALFIDAHAAFAPDGTAFVEFLGGAGDPAPDLWVYRSTDGGRRWAGPTVVTGPFDFARLAAGLHRGTPRLFVAVAGSGGLPIFSPKRPGNGCVILRSDDGGRTLATVKLLAPTTLRHQPSNSPVVLPDGRLVVMVQDFPTARSPEDLDQQVTRSRFLAAHSADGGETFSLPAPVCEAPLWHSDVGIAADLTGGPRRGRLFAVSHSAISEPPGLRLRCSDDGEVRWSKPAEVPVLRGGLIPHVAVAVSSHGVLGVAWIHGEPGSEERQGRPAEPRDSGWDLYFTASVDGGKSFARPVPLLERPYRTDAKLTPRWPYGTDYISLATPPDGSFHLLWVDSRGGKGAMGSARIGVDERPNEGPGSSGKG